MMRQKLLNARTCGRFQELALRLFLAYVPQVTFLCTVICDRVPEAHMPDIQVLSCWRIGAVPPQHTSDRCKSSSVQAFPALENTERGSPACLGYRLLHQYCYPSSIEAPNSCLHRSS